MFKERALHRLSGPSPNPPRPPVPQPPPRPEPGPPLTNPVPQRPIEPRT